MSQSIFRTTPIRTLAEWPLSKVDLVTMGGDAFILKTVHPDFKDEIARQHCLAKTLKAPLFTPAILDVSVSEGRPSFLMEYVEGTEPDEDQLLEAIACFHRQTKALHSDASFKHYTHERFTADLIQAREFLADFPADGFSEVFAGPTSVVHGDWKGGQSILSARGMCILDFGKSFYGPSALDYAYYFKDNTSLGLDKIPLGRDLTLHAKLVTLVMQACWYMRCRDHYIQYDYTKEFAQVRSDIAEVILLLGN